VERLSMSAMPIGMMPAMLNALTVVRPFGLWLDGQSAITPAPRSGVDAVAVSQGCFAIRAGKGFQR
jgi:hypothetical protein